MSLRALNKRDLLTKIPGARSRVRAEIASNVRAGSRVSSGLANEGYAGGYLAALDDIEALLEHGTPADLRGYWRKHE